MTRLFGHLRAHPHLAVAALLGIISGLLAPGAQGAIGRILLGWNVGVWIYLAWTGWTMARSDAAHLKRIALAQAEGARTVLIVVALAALASLGAIILELAGAKAAGPGHALPHVLLTLSTIVGSWLLMPTLFSLNYASLYHAGPGDEGGLKFPDTDAAFEPDYSDFLYFSFTIAVASQTADVAVTNRATRRLVLMQALLSFVFNTTILAFTINIAAGLF
jgi:uncharacterized membrane protein